MITYAMSDTTTTTYYLHSTVLGGKTIAELNGDGSFANSFVYSGGSRIATKNYSTNETSFEATNPVTGAAITTDANGTYAKRQEPDPLGRELATAPDPTIAVDPLASSKWNDPMPIEYAPQWTGEMQSGMRDYLRDVDAATERYIYNANKREFLHALFDLVRTGNNKYYDKMLKVLTKNPNFEISIDGNSVAGREAANALAGAMAKLPGDPLGLNTPEFAHAPQNPLNGPGQPQPCPPTYESLKADPEVIKAMNEAFDDSQVGTTKAHEEGGWIFQNLYNRNTTVVRWPSGGPRSIDRPPIPPKPGARLVGEFHIHPGRKDQLVRGMPGKKYGDPSKPTIKDNEGAFNDSLVPGLIMYVDNRGRRQVSPYGPKRGPGPCDQLK